MAQLEEIEDEEAPSRIIAQQRALAQEADAFAAAPPRTNPSGAAPFDFKAGNGKGFFENLIASIFEVRLHAFDCSQQFRSAGAPRTEADESCRD